MEKPTIAPRVGPAAGRRSRGVRMGLPDLIFPYYHVCNSAYARTSGSRSLGAVLADTSDSGIKPRDRSEGAEAIEARFAKLPIQQA